MPPCRIHAEGIAEAGGSPFFEWVKERSHLSRGITHGTLLRDDTYRFLRLGTFFERADNTARILDVKYHILLPSLSEVGGAAEAPPASARPASATPGWAQRMRQSGHTIQTTTPAFNATLRRDNPLTPSLARISTPALMSAFFKSP